MKLVRAFAREYQLKVELDDNSAVRRTIRLTGTAQDIQKAFGVELNQKTINGIEYRLREGSIHLPKSLTGLVEAVLGLDNRPQAQPHFRVHQPKQSGLGCPSSYTPPQVATRPTNSRKRQRTGQTIGIIELGGGYGRPTSPPTSRRSASQRPASLRSASTAGRMRRQRPTVPTEK